MALKYDLSLSELMDFFCEGEHQGFPEGGIQGAETRLGITAPPAGNGNPRLWAYGNRP